MDKEQIQAAVAKAKDISGKRNFRQSFDLIINLKDLDLKKPEQSVNTYVTLHYGRGKTCKICAIVGPKLMTESKKVCDFTISTDDFAKYAAKKDIRKLANSYDFFIAQSSIMPKVAMVFGRYLGPKGKMPNPKIGSVLTPASNIKQLCDNLKKTILLVTKNEPTIKCRIGNEDTKDEEAIDNISENPLIKLFFL